MSANTISWPLSSSQTPEIPRKGDNYNDVKKEAMLEEERRRDGNIPYDSGKINK